MGFHNSIKDGRDGYFAPIKLRPCCYSGNLLIVKSGIYFYVVCDKCKKGGPKKINKQLASIAWNKAKPARGGNEDTKRQLER